MAKQPVVESAAGADFFQKVCQPVRLEIGVDFLLNCCRCAVCDDVIDLPVQPLQRLSGVLIFLVGRQFLLPPRNVVDAKLSAIAAQSIVALVKIRTVHVQNPIRNVMALRAAHREERSALQLERLSAHQMENMRAYSVNLPSVPLLDGVFVQGIEIFMVSVYKQDGKRQRFQFA